MSELEDGSVTCCLLDVTGLPHPWTHSSCAHTQASADPSIDGGAGLQVPPLTEELLH